MLCLGLCFLAHDRMVTLVHRQGLKDQVLPGRKGVVICFSELQFRDLGGLVPELLALTCDLGEPLIEMTPVGVGLLFLRETFRTMQAHQAEGEQASQKRGETFWHGDDSGMCGCKRHHQCSPRPLDFAMAFTDS